MSIETIRTSSTATAPWLARVRMPDDSEQDVELARGRTGQLVAKLVDGSPWRSPAVVLDFTQGTAPRVTWAHPAMVPLAASLEIVSKVCDALARAANGDPLDSLSIEVEVVPEVAEPPAPRARPSRHLALGAAMGAMVAVLVPVAFRSNATPVTSEPTPIARPKPPPVVLASAITLPAAVAMTQPKPEPTPPAPVAAPKPLAHRRHRLRLLGTTVEHRVHGVAPGTGLVALRTEPGLEVAVDGSWVGMTPVRPISLSEGSHVLELRTGKRAETLELGVDDGDKTTLVLGFE